MVSYGCVMADTKINKFYPICIYFIEEKYDDPFYLAYCPDFGLASCSAVGETINEALINLEEVKKEVIDYFLNNKKQLPIASKILF